MWMVSYEAPSKCSVSLYYEIERLSVFLGGPYHFTVFETCLPVSPPWLVNWLTGILTVAHMFYFLDWHCHRNPHQTSGPAKKTHDRSWSLAANLSRQVFQCLTWTKTIMTYHERVANCIAAAPSIRVFLWTASVWGTEAARVATPRMKGQLFEGWKKSWAVSLFEPARASHK